MQEQLLLNVVANRRTALKVLWLRKGLSSFVKLLYFDLFTWKHKTINKNDATKMNSSFWGLIIYFSGLIWLLSWLPAELGFLCPWTTLFRRQTVKPMHLFPSNILLNALEANNALQSSWEIFLILPNMGNIREKFELNFKKLCNFNKTLKYWLFYRKDLHFFTRQALLQILKELIFTFFRQWKFENSDFLTF